MKRVIFATVSFFLVDVILATTCRIDVEKCSNTDMVKVIYDRSVTELAAGEVVDFGKLGKGCWNGTVFSMTSGSLSGDELKITSNDIAVVFDSFRSSKCEVCSPKLKILGKTQVNELTAGKRWGKNIILDVVGHFSTKNLNISGQIEVNGEVNIQKDGALSIKNSLGEGSITINGKLISEADLEIDTTKNLFAQVKNNGEIAAGTGVINCSTYGFINGKGGHLYGKEVSFLTEQFENDGIMEFLKFNLSLPKRKGVAVRHGLNEYSFIQRGMFVSYQEARLNFNLESFGNTYIGHLIFPNISSVKVSDGKTVIDKISGRTSLVQTTNGAMATIVHLEDGADYLESIGTESNLTISKLHSDRKIDFSSKLKGKLNIGEVQAPESFMYSEDGTLNISGLKSKSTAFIKGTAALNAKGTTNLTLVAEQKAKTEITQSFVKEMYALGDSSNILGNTEVSNLRNQASVRAVSTHIQSVENNKDINFVGNTQTDKLSNNGIAKWEEGTHKIHNYKGDLGSKIEVKDTNRICDGVKTLGLCKNKKSEDAIVKEKNKDQIIDEVKRLVDLKKSVILQTGSSLVTINNIAGTGDIEAFRQIYNKKLPTMFHTIGNVAAVLDYMPHPDTIPDHDSGDFLILANMHEDYVNSRDINYGDALVFMQMNGYKWENNHAKFIAGGLVVNNALSWGNAEGFIGLKSILGVKAGMIYNVATPIARDNGRWVDDWSNWRARLIYYCPATYYSANPRVGVAVMDGDIKLASNNDIVNHFATMYTAGKIEAVAKGKLENKVGSIVAEGCEKSKIKAAQVVNTCLSTIIRKGEAHAKGRCGWGFGRHTWYADSYTAETVTQSPGSLMLFKGDTEVIGTVENTGSKLLSKGAFSGNVNSRSVLENIAMHGSQGRAIEEDFKNYQSAFLFVHMDKEAK